MTGAGECRASPLCYTPRLYESNDDYRTDANDEHWLVALPMIVC